VQLSLDHFNQPLQAGHIPQSVVHLSLTHFNQPLQVGHIPQSVVHLSLTHFKQPLQVGHIPQSVTHLSIGGKFDQSLQVGYIPQSVTHLSMVFFYQPLQVGHIPQSVTHLSFDIFDQPLQVGHIPQSVTQLSMSSFNQPLQVGHIPQSVTRLSIPSFNLPLQVGHIPQSVTHMSFGKFDQPLQVGHIPPSVIQLSMRRFNQPIQVGHIPLSVMHLELTLFNHPLQVGHIPKYVTSLTFGREFNQLLKTEHIQSVRSLSIQCPQFSPENISLLGHNCLNELSIVHVATKDNCKSVGTSSLLHQETISHLSKMNTLLHLIIKIKPRKCLKGIDGGMPFSTLYSLLKFIPTITLQFCFQSSDAIDFEIIWRLVDDKTALLVPISDADDNGVVLFWKFATHKPGAVTTFKNSTASQAEPNLVLADPGES
ncbi:hypothetical protein SAMD00019534_099290, partial [Acytostelium subglobosum LB1]|uniref:hypothetical protein n=1 Tax=Acytostelium subglobosum LB1 TaxID=1410327 RepID=UPI0006447D8E